MTIALQAHRIRRPSALLGDKNGTGTIFGAGSKEWLFRFLALALLLSARSLPGQCTLTPVSLNQTISGSLDSLCLTPHRVGSYARLYTFTVAANTNIQIDMTASFDTYLFLLSGAGSGGAALASDDDYGGGTNSRLVGIIGPGTYTIVATTYLAGESGPFQLQLRSLTGGGSPGACQLGLAVNERPLGTLDSSCQSIHRSGKLAKYYTFSLASTTNVQIDMTATFDTYLFLLSGGTSGPVLAADDDSGTGQNSRIARTLAPGTYTIEATSYYQSIGVFQIFLAAETAAACDLSIAINQSVPGSLETSCPSVHRSGRYAKYYTFNLQSTTAVQIDMTGAFDTFLFLVNGSGSGGAVLTSDDDSGAGNNARITRSLSPGSYTIEATSYSQSVTGSFGLSVSTGPSSCVSTINVNQSLLGNLESSCPSAHRTGKLAKYYVFTLAASASVQIDMSAPFDAYLFLLNGNGSDGAVLASDDDSGPGSSARLRRVLSPGTYTIEATSYYQTTATSFQIDLVREEAETVVFLVHGLGQSSADMNGLAENLRGPSGLDPTRFRIDSGFDFVCARDVSCSSSCTIEDGAQRLAEHVIANSSEGSSIVLIGYSLGGLISREMMVSNPRQVFPSRRMAGLVTLGTPNLGYPYCDRVDHQFRCGTLLAQMASQWRLMDRRITMSFYLFDLYSAWVGSSFPGQTDRWLAVAGTSCSEAERDCEWNEANASIDNGCPTFSANTNRSDGVVCEVSAVWNVETNRQPSRRWRDPQFAHASLGWWVPGWFMLCRPEARDHVLSNPPPGTDVFREILELLNAL